MEKPPPAKTTFFRYKIHHILLWLGYYAFWTAFYRDYYKSLPALLFVISIYFVFNAGSFYHTAYVLLPRLLYRQKVVQFLLSVLLNIAVCSSGLALALYLFFTPNYPEIGKNLSVLVQMSVLSIGTMTGFLTAIKLIVDRTRMDNLHRQQEQQRVEAELQFLKAQVNPHFLFNAINSVYFLIHKDQHKAAETLIRLSDLLRFQLYDCSTDVIPMQKEIEYLENYIELEKIRKGDRVRVSFRTSGEIGRMTIAPFLLLPFLENSFKYVSTVPDHDNFVDIELILNENRLDAVFVNSIDQLGRRHTGGIGHTNVKRRLQLLYPGKHSLTIQNDHQLYNVHLTLFTS